MMKRLISLTVAILLISAFSTAVSAAAEVADPYGSHIVNDHASAAPDNKGDNGWHNPGVMHQGKFGWQAM